MQTTAQRPMGITILAVLAIIGGALNVLAALGGFSAGLGSFLGILSLLILVLGIAQLAFGYGAWTLQPWAWTLGLAVEGAIILFDILLILAGASITSVLIGVVVAAAILYYLFTPEIKKAFGQ